jgi:hypothetical protein
MFQHLARMPLAIVASLVDGIVLPSESYSSANGIVYCHVESCLLGHPSPSLTSPKSENRLNVMVMIIN